MKKIFTGLCGLLVLTAIAAFVAIKPKIDFQHKLDSRLDDTGFPTSLILPGSEIKDMNELLTCVHTAVLAQVDSIEDDAYDGSGWQINLSTNEVLWGSCPYDKLIIFDDWQSHILEIGKEYLFFIRALNVYAYPENSYNIMESKSVYMIENGRLYGNVKAADEWLSEENNTLSKMREYLAKYPAPYSENTNTVPDSYESISAMYEASDSVAKVKITSVFEENDNVELVNIEVLESYKGEAIGSDYTYIWPKGLEIGNEYFVFADENGLPMARTGAIIGEGDEAFGEAEEFLADK